MSRLLLPLLAAALCGVALAAELSGSQLLETEAFSGKDSDGLPAVYAVAAVLDGEPLALLPGVPAYADCATACRLNGSCTVFLFCGAQAGCGMPDNSTLRAQECQLLTDTNCTLAPSVVAHGVQEGVDPLLVSGFPVRSKAPPTMPGLVATQAQGVFGGDFSCPDSVVEGACAFRDVLAAAFRCSSLLIGTCQSVVVYVNGTSGCQGALLAVLKTAKPLPDNTYWAPTVYILNKMNEAGTFILYNEATLTPPDNETRLNEMSVVPIGNAAASPANVSTTPAPICVEGASAWMGCVLVNLPAVMGGMVNRTIDGVASAEACCRACREAGRSACNVFNWCPANATCSFQDSSSVMTLQPQQCELRYQELVDPSNGVPPYMMAKGAAAGSFRAGAPVSAWGPPLPGYDRQIAGGLYAQPGTPCPDRIKPEYPECILSAPLPQIADRCSGDALCNAVISKPCGFFNSTDVNIGGLRQEQGANASLMVRNPTSVVYFKQQPASSSSGGGLSSGAITGIAVGCAVVAVAAAAAGWVLVRRRRAARTAVLEPEVGSEKGLEHGVTGAAAPALCFDKSAGWPEGGVYSGVLGCAPLGSSASTSSKGSWPRPQQHAFASGGGSSGSGGGPVLKGAVIGRPTAASPFAAAAARLRKTPPTSTTCSPANSNGVEGATAMQLGGAAGYPAVGTQCSRDAVVLSSGEASGPAVEPELQVELSRVMGELIQHRQLEEEEACQPYSSGQSAADTSAPGSASPRSQPLERAALLAGLQEWLIPAEEVRYLRRPNGELAVLGEGASGRVIRAELRGELVAAKEMEIGRALELQQAFIAEAQQLCNLRHANIVTFYGCCINKGRGVLLTELCEGRDLGSVLQLESAPGQRVFGWYKNGCRIAFEVAKALNYLHSHNVAHMDIKSNNVLLTSRGMAKLADVGLARMQTRTVMSDLPQMVGTFAWVAPEVLLGGQGCTLAVDIYSFGVLLWEIITGMRPVRGHMRSIHVPAECPQDAADLMAACCTLDPATRPSARDLMKRLQAMLVAQKEGRRSEVEG